MRTIVHVIRNPSGWWDVRTSSGDVLVRYLSELQAREAARSAAEQMRADLAFHQDAGPVMYEEFDDTTNTLKPAAARPFLTGSLSP